MLMGGRCIIEFLVGSRPLQTCASNVMVPRASLPSPKPALALVLLAALLIASGALFLTIDRGDVLGPLFRYGPAIQVIAMLFVWSLLAWSARRLIVGKLPTLALNSWAALIWAGSRVALLFAIISVMAGWLIALVLGLEVETAFARAIVLLVVVTALTGMISGAFLNSFLAVRHWRARKSK